MKTITRSVTNDSQNRRLPLKHYAWMHTNPNIYCKFVVLLIGIFNFLWYNAVASHFRHLRLPCCSRDPCIVRTYSKTWNKSSHGNEISRYTAKLGASWGQIVARTRSIPRYSAHLVSNERYRHNHWQIGEPHISGSSVHTASRQCIRLRLSLHWEWSN